jgi:septum formation protein
MNRIDTNAAPEGRAILILASASPRRRELLAEAGYAFRVVEPHPLAECGICSRETPGELVARLARQKAADVAGRIHSDTAGHCPAEVIVGCDTVVECLGQVLGKPVDREHARSMLQRLRGQVHRVYSGLCVWPVGQREPRTRVACTRLRMDRLDDSQIDEYLASGLWEGKAGAFGYQDRHGWLQLTEGRESNVVGLPLELLAEMLAEVQESCGKSAERTPPD